MSKKEEDVISQRLQDMADFAENRRKLLEKEGKKLADKHQYIRIGGKGFRALSVSKEHPLIGYADSTTNSLDTILSQFNKDGGLPSKPLEKEKEETRLQSLMIQHALDHENRLDGIINCKSSGLDDKFDEIHFVMDEVSLGDKNNKVPLAVSKKGEPETSNGIIRCDILAVGIKGNEAHPILMELKGERLQGLLLDQLKNFSELITDHFPGDFENIFKACLGRSVDCSKCYQFSIWPKPKGSKRVDKLEERKSSPVKFFEYQYEQGPNTCTITDEDSLP